MSRHWRLSDWPDCSYYHQLSGITPNGAQHNLRSIKKSHLGISQRIRRCIQQRCAPSHCSSNTIKRTDPSSLLCVCICIQRWWACYWSITCVCCLWLVMHLWIKKKRLLLLPTRTVRLCFWHAWLRFWRQYFWWWILQRIMSNEAVHQPVLSRWFK